MEILQFSEVPSKVLEGIQHVHKAVFEGRNLKAEKIEGKHNFLAFVAVVDGVVAGFKMGYEVEEGVFYSWLGGVNPSFQKRGIAKSLMEAQHEELKKCGYKIVRTYSRNERRAMLLLNIKYEFNVIETFIDHKGRHKIVLEKML